MKTAREALLELAAACETKGHRLYKVGQSACHSWQLGEVPPDQIAIIDQCMIDLNKAWAAFNISRTPRPEENDA